MKKTGISMLNLLFPLAVWALSGPGQVMQQAGALYGQGEKERAIKLWEGLRESGYLSPTLFYNLGNGYLESGELGKALLNYERALLIQPGHSSIRHNHQLAMAQVKGDPLPWPEAGLVLRWRMLRSVMSSNAWAGVGLFACWTAFAAWWWSRRREKKWPWILASTTGALLAVSAWIWAVSASRALESGYSIVMEDALRVQVGPDEQSGEVATVYEGWKVRRLDQIGGWIKVELADGQEGWVQETGIENL